MGRGEGAGRVCAVAHLHVAVGVEQHIGRLDVSVRARVRVRFRVRVRVRVRVRDRHCFQAGVAHLQGNNVGHWVGVG